MDGVVLAGVGEQLEPVAVPPHGLVIAPGAGRVGGVTVSDDGARPADLAAFDEATVWIDAANVVQVRRGLQEFPPGVVPICYVDHGEIIDCRVIEYAP